MKVKNCSRQYTKPLCCSHFEVFDCILKCVTSLLFSSLGCSKHPCRSVKGLFLQTLSVTEPREMYGSARAVGHMEGSPARSPRLPRSPRLGHRRANSGSSGCKTLSMENIQSLNAAYATSGPMYLSDHEGVGSTATYPKGTMMLGRAASRVMYGGRVTAMGSTPNIATVGLPHADLLSYGDLGSLSMLHHQGTPSALLRQAVRSSGGELLELQVQMRDMQRENELLRRELDLKDSKLGSSNNSIKSFWSPELKKERVMRKEEAARTSILKEQMRVTHEENQVRMVTLPYMQNDKELLE